MNEILEAHYMAEASRLAAEREQFVQGMTRKHLLMHDRILLWLYKRLNRYFSTRIIQKYRYSGPTKFGVKIYDKEYWYE